MDILDVARSYVAAGLSVVPIRPLPQKAPDGDWAEYQIRLPNDAELMRWFPSHDRIGIVTGSVSGNLLLLDFDHDPKHTFDAWRKTVGEDLYVRCVVEQSPSGGVHVWFRHAGDVACKNTKLARKVHRPAPSEIYKNAAMKDVCKVDGKEFVLSHGCCQPTLIETRGEGGQGVAYPTHGYCLRRGSFAAIPTFSIAETETLLNAAMSLSEWLPTTKVAPVPKLDGLWAKRPGDEFNARGDVRAILAKAGWGFFGQGKEGELWSRPGKSDGPSATLFPSNVLFVFSSNASPFEPDTGYSAFSVFGMLEHSGNWSAAAKDLCSQGYGTPPTPLVLGPADPPKSAMPFARPLDTRDLVAMFDGTPIGVFVTEALRTEPRMNPIIPITCGYAIQACLMSRSVTLHSRIPNLYAGILASKSSGKGLCSRAMYSVLQAFGVPCMGSFSSKTLYKKIAQSPWGLHILDEFEPYMTKGTWEHNVVTHYTQFFDGSVVSTGAERSGFVEIANAAPSILFSVQPTLWRDVGGATMSNNGFLSRTLIANVADDQEPATEFGISASPVIDVAPIVAAYRQAYAWLPPSLKPDAGTEGRHIHPRSQRNIVAEPYPKCKLIMGDARGFERDLPRYVQNYLPLLAVPFERVDTLASGVLTAAALERAEYVLLSYVWGLFEGCTLLPETEYEKLVMRLAHVVNSQSEPLNHSQLAKRVGGYSRPMDFENALEVCRMRSLFQVTKGETSPGKYTFAYQRWPRTSSACPKPSSMPVAAYSGTLGCAKPPTVVSNIPRMDLPTDFDCLRDI